MALRAGLAGETASEWKELCSRLQSHQHLSQQSVGRWLEGVGTLQLDVLRTGDEAAPDGAFRPVWSGGSWETMRARTPLRCFRYLQLNWRSPREPWTSAAQRIHGIA